MQRTLMVTATFGVALGGYYFAGAAEYLKIPLLMAPAINSPAEDMSLSNGPVGAYAYYAQPDLDVTFDGEVIFVWEDPE